MLTLLHVFSTFVENPDVLSRLRLLWIGGEDRKHENYNYKVTVFRSSVIEIMAMKAPLHAINVKYVSLKGTTNSEEHDEVMKRYREHVKEMLLGTGFGDIAYSKGKLFETYKPSLYYFLMRALGQRDKIVEWIEDNIDRFIVNGGVVTRYNSDLTPMGDPNVETTVIIQRSFRYIGKSVIASQP